MSSLEVDFLNGAPGVYTARYAGEICTYADNVNKLFNVMKNVPIKDRGAQFKTSMVFLDKNNPLEIKPHNRSEGRRQGSSGFFWGDV